MSVTPLLKQTRYRRYFAICFDFMWTPLCFYIAMAIRYESLHINQIPRRILYPSLFITFLVQSLTFYLFSFYKGIWRYSSIPDLLRLIKGVSLGVILTFIVLFFYNRLHTIPRSAFIIDWLLLITILGGSRLAYRIWKDHLQSKQSSHKVKRVIIVGAGSGGDQLYRDIKKNPDLAMRVVAFVDDSKQKIGGHMHGITVEGGIDKLPKIVETHQADVLFIAIPSATGDQIRRIVDASKDLEVEFKTLPKMKDLIQGKVILSQLRNIELEDLLGRKEIILDNQSIESMIQDKIVLVTGAGGSIGSELCLQLVKFKPKLLICVDQSEFNVYRLENLLLKQVEPQQFKTFMADVTIRAQIEQVFQTYSPNIVLHAAAYKHVHLMENNPYQSVRVNVSGTKTVVELAKEYKVDRFVLVSTDKAVRPTNVMGATKRVAEVILQKIQKESTHTKFMTVRFGNVLGSSGSVIPRFKEQIEQGGPVTVTHPDITRYFMTIPEACVLIIQAATMGKGGDIFLLEMGQPVKIMDLAKQMITLAGLKVDEDIQIKISGLRPGEKLYEELLMPEEAILPTWHPLLKVAKAREVDQHFVEQVNTLLSLSSDDEHNKFKQLLLKLVPDYNPDKQLNHQLHQATDGGSDDRKNQLH